MEKLIAEFLLNISLSAAPGFITPRRHSGMSHCVELDGQLCSDNRSHKDYFLCVPNHTPCPILWAIGSSDAPNKRISDVDRAIILNFLASIENPNNPAKVTTKDGIPTKADIAPWKIPTQTPADKAAKQLIGAGIPRLVVIAAQTPEVAATDKSISPINKTIVIPTAKVPTTELCMKEVVKITRT